MVRLSVALAAALAGGVALAAPFVGTLRNPDLDELSGLAVSRRDPTVLWGHNDTGSGPVLYRIGTDGADLGTVPVPGAQSEDWEDIAAFEDAGGPALLIADVGDNLEFRPYVTLYAVRDPGRDGDAARLLWRLDFRYPDGARDCEAVAVDSTLRQIVLVSKRDYPPRAYALPLPQRPPQRQHYASALGALPHLPAVKLGERLRSPLRAPHRHSPSAFDIAADGRSAVVVTSMHAYRYRRQPAQSWGEALQQPPQIIALPELHQIEAAALSADGRTLYVGGEDRPGGFARLELGP